MILATQLGMAEPALPKIVDAALFKNGYAVVTREITLDADGDTSIVDVPRPSLGTLWFFADRNAQLQSTTVESVTSDVKTDAQSIEDFVRVNVGKEMTLTLNDNTVVTGKLTSFRGGALTLQTAEGTLVLRNDSIRRVLVKGEVNTSFTTQTKQRALRIRSKGAGKLRMIGVESGLTWAPAYLVDISDKKTLKLTAKSTVLNDLSPIKDIELRMVTGFPNIPFLGTEDPFLSQWDVDTFTKSMIGSSGGPGGFGGGGRGAMMSQNMAAAREADFAPVPMSDLPGQSEGDLFFYRQPNFSLDRGGRAYLVLFELEVPYKHVYTWDIGDSLMGDRQYVGIPEGPGDVWHSLKFRNTGKNPFTTAPAMTMSNGQVIGQDMMHYTSVGAEAKLRINKALDIRAEGIEEEISRVPFSREEASFRRNYDLITIKGTIDVSNRKDETVTMEVSKDLTGEVLESSHDAKVTKTAKGLRGLNPNSVVKWTVDVPAGKSVQLTYSYKVYIPN